jgi:hypothetical protein
VTPRLEPMEAGMQHAPRLRYAKEHQIEASRRNQRAARQCDSILTISHVLTAIDTHDEGTQRGIGR